jgi:hypothetical protein
MANKKFKNKKRALKKIEPIIWSDQVLWSLLWLSLAGLMLGFITVALAKLADSFFHLLIYPFMIAGQFFALFVWDRFFEIDPKIRPFFIVSLVFLVIIEAFFIWKYILLLFQFLVMFGVAASGLAFIGHANQKKLGIISPLKRTHRKIYSRLGWLPFLWFLTYLAIVIVIPFLGINPQSFLHFSLAPSVAVIASLNLGFLSGFLRNSVHLRAGS